MTVSFRRKNIQSLTYIGLRRVSTNGFSLDDPRGIALVYKTLNLRLSRRQEFLSETIPEAKNAKPAQFFDDRFVRQLHSGK